MKQEQGLTCRDRSISIEDGTTVVLRVQFASAYAAMEWHDRLASYQPPFQLVVTGSKLRSVEAPDHPIESFPCKLDRRTPIDKFDVFAFITICWIIGVIYG